MKQKQWESKKYRNSQIEEENVLDVGWLTLKIGMKSFCVA